MVLDKPISSCFSRELAVCNMLNTDYILHLTNRTELSLSVTDFINQLVQVLRRELTQLRDSVQGLDKETELDLVKPWDKR